MLSAEQRERIRVVAAIGAIVALVPVCLTLRIEARVGQFLLITDESRYYLPREEWLVPLTMGYREAAAGLAWTRCLVYFGEETEVRGRFEFLETYLIGVTTLDPYFYRAYIWGSNASIYNGNAIDRDAVEMSIRMLKRGLQAFPDNGDIHYYLGFQYYFELAPIVPPSEAEEARRIGMDEICTGAMLGGGPTYLPNLCSNLLERQGMQTMAVERIASMLVETEDVATRTRLEERLEGLMTREAAFGIMQQINAFRTRWRRERSYVPLGFYALTGPNGVVPPTDQLDLPLPMDGFIRASEEELLQRLTVEDEDRASAEESDVPFSDELFSDDGTTESDEGDDVSSE